MRRKRERRWHFDASSTEQRRRATQGARDNLSAARVRRNRRRGRSLPHHSQPWSQGREPARRQARASRRPRHKRAPVLRLQGGQGIQKRRGRGARRGVPVVEAHRSSQSGAGPGFFFAGTASDALSTNQLIDLCGAEGAQGARRERRRQSPTGRPRRRGRHRSRPWRRRRRRRSGGALRRR